MSEYADKLLEKWKQKMSVVTEIIEADTIPVVCINDCKIAVGDTIYLYNDSKDQ